VEFGFDEAEEAFFDPLALMTSDEGHSFDEDRFRLLGRSRRNRLLMTVFTWRGDKIRIISAWRATRREVKGYEERIRF
jgi:uncharacterized DUF497 family protein